MYFLVIGPGASPTRWDDPWARCGLNFTTNWGPNWGVVDETKVSVNTE